MHTRRNGKKCLLAIFHKRFLTVLFFVRGDIFFNLVFNSYLKFETFDVWKYLFLSAIPKIQFTNYSNITVISDLLTRGILTDRYAILIVLVYSQSQERHVQAFL